MKKILASCCALSLFAVSLQAKAEDPSAELAFMKSLSGQWTGTAETSKHKEKVFVQYEITSNGSAVLERLFSGSPHEMLSVYHIDGDHLAMTHYCAVGNQPHLVLKKREGNSLHFDFVSATNLKSPDDPHMRTLVLTKLPDGKLRQEWTGYKDGKAKETTVVSLWKSGTGA